MKNPHPLSCNSKKRWQTWRRATKTANVMRKKEDVRGLNVYPCKHCGGFHLGHPDKYFREDGLAEIEKPSPERMQHDRERLDVMLKGAPVNGD